MIKKFENKKILVVEDEEFLRESIIEEFKFHGAEVFEAAGGNEAFKIYQENEIDIVFTDIRMPDGNGFELIKNIFHYSLKNCPKIFVCTGYSEHSEEEMQKYGVKKIFKKPFDFDEIINMMS